MKNKKLIFLLLSLILISCNNEKKLKEKMLGTWEVVSIDCSDQNIIDNAVKIDFFEGTKGKINPFIIYLNDGTEIEGSWNAFRGDKFAFHYNHQNTVSENFILNDNQFSCDGNELEYNDESNEYEPNRKFSMILKRQ